MSEGAFKKVLKYCSIVEFFNDLARAMLLGMKAFDQKKAEIEYKPVGIEALINHSIKSSDLETMFEGKNLSHRNDPNDSLLQDELNIEALDIDGIKSIVSAKVKKSYKDLVTKNDVAKKPLSRDIMKNYPSLREKYNIVEEKIEYFRKTDDGSSYSKDDLSSIEELDQRRKLLDSVQSTKSQKVAIQLNNSKTNVIIQTKKSVAHAFNFQNSKEMNAPSGFGQSQHLSTLVSPASRGKLTRPVSKQDDYGFRTKTAERLKRDIATANSESIKADVFRNLKAGNMPSDRSKVTDSASYAQYRDVNQSDISNQNSAFKNGLENKKFMNSNILLPERITLAKEFINDAMSHEEAELLNSLYPISASERGESLIDKEAKQTDFTIANIKLNERFATAICGLFENIIHKALTSSRPDALGEEARERILIKEDPGKRLRYEMNKKIGRLDVNYGPLWDVMFLDNAFVFNKLLKVKVPLKCFIINRIIS